MNEKLFDIGIAFNFRYWVFLSANFSFGLLAFCLVLIFSGVAGFKITNLLIFAFWVLIAPIPITIGVVANHVIRVCGDCFLLGLFILFTYSFYTVYYWGKFFSYQK